MADPRSLESFLQEIELSAPAETKIEAVLQFVGTQRLPELVTQDIPFLAREIETALDGAALLVGTKSLTPDGYFLIIKEICLKHLSSEAALSTPLYLRQELQAGTQKIVKQARKRLETIQKLHSSGKSPDWVRQSLSHIYFIDREIPLIPGVVTAIDPNNTIGARLDSKSNPTGVLVAENSYGNNQTRQMHHVFAQLTRSNPSDGRVPETIDFVFKSYVLMPFYNNSGFHDPGFIEAAFSLPANSIMAFENSQPKMLRGLFQSHNQRLELAILSIIDRAVRIDSGELTRLFNQAGLKVDLTRYLETLGDAYKREPLLLQSFSFNDVISERFLDSSFERRRRIRDLIELQLLSLIDKPESFEKYLFKVAALRAEGSTELNPSKVRNLLELIYDHGDSVARLSVATAAVRFDLNKKDQLNAALAHFSNDSAFRADALAAFALALANQDPRALSESHLIQSALASFFTAGGSLTLSTARSGRVGTSFCNLVLSN